MKITCLFSILIVATQLLNAQIDSQKLDAYFDALYKKNKFMGSVAVMEKGALIYNKQVGFIDATKSKKPNKTTSYHIGSITKMFTSVLVLKAIEAHKISLDEKLATFFPEIKNAKSISIKNMLQHRSGIRDFTRDPKNTSLFYQENTPKILVKIISNYAADFTPDEKFEYSNSNYLLLTYILENIYNDSYEHILQDKIIEPLQLVHTSFSKEIDPNKNEALSFFYNEEWQKTPTTHFSVAMGAGSIASTPSDLLKFQNALFNAEIISQENLTKMMVLKDNYGLGIFTIPYENKMAFGHNGRIDGFQSMMLTFLDTKKSVVILSNALNYDLNTILLTLLDASYEKDFEVPDFKTIEISLEDLSTLEGTYSSPTFPLKITISNNGKQLVAQATGQGAIVLETISKTSFEFLPAGIVLEFEPSKKEMTLKQGGGAFVLTKQ